MKGFERRSVSQDVALSSSHEDFEHYLVKLRRKDFGVKIDRIHEAIMQLYMDSSDTDEISENMQQLLENGDADAVLSTVKDTIQKEIQAGLFESANHLAKALNLHAEIEKVNSAWLDHAYKQYESMSLSERESFVQDTDMKRYRTGIEGDPRFQELHFSRYMTLLKSLYKDKKKKTGRAFQRAVSLCQGNPGLASHIKDMAPSLYENIHKQAVQEVHRLKDPQIG